MLQVALKLCQQFELKLRPIGWHVALTGSTLYGMGEGPKPADVDLILYPNSDDVLHDETMEELLETIGIQKFEVLDSDDYERPVYRATSKTGIRTDFFIAKI